MRMSVPWLAGALLLAGCGSQLPTAPSAPPLPAETIPLPPVSEAPMVWRPGDWLYTDGSYRYDPGRYEPQAGHTLWTPGHWTGTRGSYAWVPGAWS